MIIRPAQETDAPAMGRVGVETYLRAHQGQVPDKAWQRRQAEWTPELSAAGWVRTIQELAADDEARECIYVAVENNSHPEQVIGLVMGGPSGVTAYEGSGEIYSIYVDFAHQGRGVGRQLIQAAVRHLRPLGMTALIIRSLATNTPGNHFYEALGGQWVGACEVDEYGYSVAQHIYHWADSLSLLGE